MASSWLSKVMLSASSSLISTNWPDFTLSTSLRGKGSAAGERTTPALELVCGSCGRGGFIGRWVVVVAAPEDAVEWF